MKDPKQIEERTVSPCVQSSEERVKQSQGQLDQYVEFNQDSPPLARPRIMWNSFSILISGSFSSIFSKEGGQVGAGATDRFKGISHVRMEYQGRRSCRSILANRGLIFTDSLCRVQQNMDLEHATGQARVVITWREYRSRVVTGQHRTTVKQPVDKQSLTRINNHIGRHRSALMLGLRLACLRKGLFLHRQANLKSEVGKRRVCGGHVFIFDWSPLAPSSTHHTKTNGVTHIRGRETLRTQGYCSSHHCKKLSLRLQGGLVSWHFIYIRL